MRVVSYNIRKAVGLDWRRDPERIVEVLWEIDADVVVLQEADKRLRPREGVLPLSQMENELGLVLCEVSDQPVSHGWHGNAVFAKTDLAHYTTSRIDLPSIEPRGSVSVLFHGPRLEVIGVHLGLTPGMRRKQMNALSEVIKTRKHPVLVAGDFNEWNSKRVRLSDTETIVTPGPSFHAARPVSALDRFALSGGLHAVASRVHHSELAKRASDHLPVVIDLQLTEPDT